jgi:RNA polymerase sigma-70 factor (ECF subfamily)
VEADDTNAASVPGDVRQLKAVGPSGSPLGATPTPTQDLRQDLPLDVPIGEQSDQQLLEGLRAGSERHFNELYGRYFQRIYSFVYTRMRNHADAEEVVQETFTAVYRSFESYRGTSSLLSWIYGIAKNTLNNSLRRSRTEGLRLDALRPEVLRPPSAFGDCTPEEHLSLRRYSEAIRERLEHISDWQCEIFAMRHLHNLSIREISEQTARSSDAVRSSLYRVKRLLYETAELSPAEGRPRGGATWAETGRGNPSEPESLGDSQR